MSVVNSFVIPIIHQTMNLYKIPNSIFESHILAFLSKQEQFIFRHASKYLSSVIHIKELYKTFTIYEWIKISSNSRVLYTRYIQDFSFSITLDYDAKKDDFENFYQILPLDQKNIKSLTRYRFDFKPELYPCLEKLHLARVELGWETSWFNSSPIRREELLLNRQCNNVDISIGILKVDASSTIELLQILKKLSSNYKVEHVKHLCFNVASLITPEDLNLMYSDQMPDFWRHSNTWDSESWAILLHPSFGRVTNFNKILLQCSEDQYDDSNVVRLHKEIQQAVVMYNNFGKIYPIVSVTYIEISDFGSNIIFDEALRILFTSVPNLECLVFTELKPRKSLRQMKQIVSMLRSPQSACFRNSGFIVTRFYSRALFLGLRCSEACMVIRKPNLVDPTPLDLLNKSDWEKVTEIYSF